MRRLDLVVGPHGAGKSTIVEFALASRLPGSVFVNADVIATERWPDDAEGHAYEAAAVAARTRTALIQAQKPFIAETVFSHPSKLELIGEARQAGYVVLHHVMMVSEDLAVARVARRVEAGGHSVPEGKIRGRYRRLWDLVAAAATTADTTTFYDNTAVDHPRVVAHLSSGEVIGRVDWPSWTPGVLRSRWPTSES